MALTGASAVLRGRELRALLVAEPARTREVGEPPDAQLIAHLHLRSQTDERRVVRLVRGPDGSFVAAWIGDDGSAQLRVEVLPDPIVALAEIWPDYRGGFSESEEADLPLGRVFEAEKPYTPSLHVIDQATLSERFWGGREVRIDGSRRDLEEERLFVRLPRGYDPRTPAGLLVWINAGDSGEPPAPFHKALDALGIVCIGAARSGNNRLISDRYQLALDGVATAKRRYHIDDERVYVTGISGGGRTASNLQGCFPDVFTGCVPIVGVNTFRNVPTGTGRFWPAGYMKPRIELLRLLRQRRIAPMTGNDDFNYQSTLSTARVMRQDRLDVRVFEWPDMAHTLPTPDRFLEALSWVDEPWRDARAHARAEAADRLDRYRRRFADDPVQTDAQRAMLVGVMEAGPWTAPAWEAASLLGLGTE